MKRQFRYSAFILFLLLAFSSCTKNELDVLPKLNTLQASDADITSTSAKLKGDVLVVGNQKITEYGIEMSKSQLCTSPLSQTISGSPGVGTFGVTFTGLAPNTKYYYKAYALINTARVYSELYQNFTTKP